MINKRELFYSSIAQTSPAPMELDIVKAKGLYMWDVNDKKYLDLISGISVSNVGHCHPKVVSAVQKQAETYMHLMVYGEYIQTPQVALAQKITSLLPSNLDNVYFVNSGSEANEGAMKLAKKYTKRGKIVYCKNAYHGSTQGVLSIIGDDSFKNGFGPLLPNVHPINFNNISDLSIIDKDTAAVIMENTQAEAGVLVGTKEYLRAVREKCNEVGALLIFDEVQTGFGRTGKWFGFENSNVIPDIITLAKGMGGGMPIGAFVSSKEIMNELTHQPVLGHITTFGGHPVCCAAALATINAIENENLLNGIPEKSELFLSLIQHQKIKAKRAVGLLIAVEFENSEINFAIIKECVNAGIITDWFLFNDRCMRIAPPLIIQEADIIASCEIINQCIKKVLG